MAGNRIADFCRPSLYYRWHLSGNRRAPHIARLRLVEAAHTVHSLAIIPNDKVVWPPLVCINEL